MSEGHAPALKIPEPERVRDALEILKKNGIKTAEKQDHNTITIGAAEAALAADIMSRAMQNGLLQAAPQMVSAEAIPVPDHRPEPVEPKHEPHPPEGGVAFGESKEDETEQNQGSVDATGNVQLEPRSLNNRMQNKMKKIDEEEQIDELSNETLHKVANVARKKNRSDVLQAAIKAHKRNRNKPEYKFTEETEQLNELSYGKLKAYSHAASSALRSGSGADKLSKKIAQRKVYLDKAAAKKVKIIAKAAFGESKSPTDTILRIINEAGSLRLKATINSDCGKHCAKIYKDHEWNEHRVKFFVNGKHHEPADYHTDDYEDAHGTAKNELARLTKFNGALKEAAEDGTVPFLSEGLVRVGSYSDRFGNKLSMNRHENDKNHHFLVHNGKVVQSHHGPAEDFHKKITSGPDKLEGALHEGVISEAKQKIEDYKRKHVQGLYSFHHFEHPNGNFIQVHVKDKNHIIHSDRSGNPHKKFTNFDDLKKHVESLDEDVEQLDELSPATLTKYAIKAASDRREHAAKATAGLARSNAPRGEEDVKTAIRASSHTHARKAFNRHQGIKRATERLTKKPETAGVCEEVLSEGKKDDVEKAKKHMFKLPIANELGKSIHTATRHFNYVQDACDHIYNNHHKDLSFEDYDKIKPHLEDHFKAHGLK
jgi:hypothetical protein